jgi:hypothetical protein
LQSLVAKCCKICGKYNLAKFANFVFFCIAYAEIATIFGPNMVAITARNSKVYNICKLSKAIFSAFYKPNFAILTHFSMLFLAVVIYLHLLA